MFNNFSRACATAVSAVCAMSACTSLRVTSDVNTPVISTVQCHTFAWAGSFHGSSDSLRSSVANPVNESRLRAAIEANLKTVGVQPAPGIGPAAGIAPATGAPAAASGADCLVGYGIGMRNVVEGDPYGYGWGWGWRGGWGPGPGFGGWGWDYPYVYHEGIVAVDLYDAKTRQPLWHASVNQNLAGATGEKADQKIKAAVAAIFTKYPH
jgi:Domain of unknown function (DUF4136)